MRALGTWLLWLGLAVLAGCDDAPRGQTAMGEACGDAEECRHGYCIATPGSDQPVCTRSCATTDECPRGWSCSGITEDRVVVCVQGAANPFGVGARE